jgi:hypothetical protein
MQKNPKTKPVPSKRFLEFAVKTKSWHAIGRNGWIIKFSAYRENNILLFFLSQYTGQTIVRHFTNEDDACRFINYVIELNPEEIYEL